MQSAHVNSKTFTEQALGPLSWPCPKEEGIMKYDLEQMEERRARSSLLKRSSWRARDHKAILLSDILDQG